MNINEKIKNKANEWRATIEMTFNICAELSQLNVNIQSNLLVEI